MSSSWFTTKKRGRDDAAIERDRVAALTARRSKTPTVAKKKKATRSKKAQEDSSSSSIDSFIVDDDVSLKDDDDDDDDDSASTTDAEFSINTTSPNDGNSFLARRAKATCKKSNSSSKKKSSVADLCDSSSSDDSSAIQQVDRAASSKCTSMNAKKPVSRFFSQKAPPQTPDDGSPVIARKILPHRRRIDDDDEDDSCAKISSRSSNVQAPSDSSLDDDEAYAVALALSQSMAETAESAMTSLHDTPEISMVRGTGKKILRKRGGKKLFRKQTMKETKSSFVNTDIADVMEESDNADGDSVSDGNDDDNDGDDEYVDPAAREALSVLKTANDLSLQIIQTLQEWSDESVAGLISSGAVTLGSMATKKLQRHQWISQETMLQICPKLTLAEYQLVGVNWMALLHGMQCQAGSIMTNVNGILADEMGLGKTVQTIAFLSWLGRHRIREESDVIDLETTPQKIDPFLPHLVISPSSVLSNWQREFETFAPHLHVVKYHGSMEERSRLQEELRRCLPGRGSTPPDVILAPVTYFQKEKSDDRSFLRKFKYEYLVVDEAHLLKNARGTRYKSLDKFSSQHRLLLTGTPVQNSPQELLSLLCFLMPLFSRKAEPFEDDERVNDGGAAMLQHFVSLEGGSTVDENAAYGKLKQLFAPFVLRQRKEDVLSQIMPRKVQQVDFVELDSTARHLYDSILSDHIQSKKTGGTLQQREHLFTQLRKAAHHPLLLRSRHTSQSEREHMAQWFYRYGAFRGEGCTKAKVAEELERYNDFMIHLTAHDLITENPLRHKELNRYILREDDLFSSAKFVRLQQLIPKLIEEGHRILIFSGWTSCLDLLTCLLEKLKVEYLRMEGSTPVEERQGLIDEFELNTSIPVFLLSTKACGLGITVTSADTCIFYDIDFNPMNDVQAEDRCHRIGQKKEVTVIRLVSKDTVDQYIYEMQQRKMKMSQVIMETNGETQSSSGAVKEKNMVLQTAVDRFLQSPGAQPKNKALDVASSQESADCI